MQKTPFIIILLLVSNLLFAQITSDTTPEKPPLKAGKIVVEFIASTVVGMGVGYAGGLIGASVSGSGWDQLGGAIIGIGIGYPLGATAGAWVVGNTQNEQSSFWAVLGGSFAGAGLGFLALTQLKSNYTGYIYLAMVPLGATVAHNLNRRYESAPGVALLNYKVDHFYWSVPSPVLAWNPHQKNKFQTRFQLVSFSF